MGGGGGGGPSPEQVELQRQQLAQLERDKRKLIAQRNTLTSDTRKALAPFSFGSGEGVRGSSLLADSLSGGATQVARSGL